MVLVDTSVWIQHFRKSEPALVGLLHESLVLTHHLVIGELACGSFKERDQVLHDLKSLPFASSSEHEEVLHFIENRRLWGLGVGLIDVHLITSALLENSRFWTIDRRLSEVATSVGVTLFEAVKGL